jgi:hypothetical protein
MPYQWSESANRYRDTDTGQFVPREQVVAWADQSLDASASVTDALANMVAGEAPVLSPADWRDAMRTEIKKEYIRQYLSSIGGRERMTAERWGSLGGMIGQQYKFLNDFTDEIAAGKLSEAQIRARAAMYVKSAREARERARAQVASEAGWTEVLWQINPGENCEDCIAFNAMGWQLVADDPYGGCFPGSGCTQCMSNCNCGLDYRESIA